jgi:hypothetical protein
MSISRHHERHRAHSQAKRAFKKVMKRRSVGLDASRATGLHLVKLFARIERMHERVDMAYDGEPFLRGIPPNAPQNRHRFNAFVDSHSRVMKLFGRAIELWMLVFGMKKEDNWVPLLIETMRQTEQTKGQGGT